MYVPQLEQKSNELPVISKRQISRLGEQIVMDYCSDIFKCPRALEEEDFSHYYLGTVMDFQFLTHCGIYLGMTVFHDSENIPVFDTEKMRAEYICEKAETMIIEKSLLEKGQKHRYRYTIFHNTTIMVPGKQLLSDLLVITDYLSCLSLIPREMRNFNMPFAEQQMVQFENEIEEEYKKAEKVSVIFTSSCTKSNNHSIAMFY